MQKIRPLSDWMFCLFFRSPHGKSKTAGTQPAQLEKGIIVDDDEVRKGISKCLFVNHPLELLRVFYKLCLTNFLLKNKKGSLFIERESLVDLIL